MEEPDNKFNNRDAHEEKNGIFESSVGDDDRGIHRFSVDDKGRMHRYGGAAVMQRSNKTFIALGWVSAGFAAFISPYFAIAGIVLGMLANKQMKGSGNIVIISNIVLAVINLLLGFIFGLFLIGSIRQMMVFG